MTFPEIEIKLDCFLVHELLYQVSFVKIVQDIFEVIRTTKIRFSFNIHTKTCSEECVFIIKRIVYIISNTIKYLFPTFTKFKVSLDSELTIDNIILEVLHNYFRP